MTIVKTEDTLGGKPRLEGRRISVLQIAEMVIDAGRSPERVTDELEIGLDEVHEALAYYYRNIDEMNELRERKRELRERIKENSNAPEKADR
ncbi:DUF433 domain-containing protein [Haladaptatus sp. F3-133]|jgi:uncharacterized protein (DUF433 family)|uniref:DUF433 domain-containing protein n=1 Tax=Halorutilus salinus TaxID=2487751 RepID=A0A9Q4C4E2_9EURY|nr:DUF433 domain-containing protein [Halorutilus salinus]MCX2819073.1 DUF433 domain-containing protein [Halorutilus salinus]